MQESFHMLNRFILIKTKLNKREDGQRCMYVNKKAPKMQRSVINKVARLRTSLIKIQETLDSAVLFILTNISKAIRLANHVIREGCV